jgi:DNA-binding transcriptional ArsR family regulator
MSKARATKAKAEEAAERLRLIQHAAMLLKQASDPTRLRILLMLAEREWHVGALCEALNQSQPAVSHHLALLRHGRLVTPRREGKNSYYGLTEGGRMLTKIVEAVV